MQARDSCLKQNSKARANSSLTVQPSSFCLSPPSRKGSLMAITPQPHKTLRQYRKDQETKRQSLQGSDFEDWMILQCAQETPPEQALWRAVILQMITDAISNSQKPDNKRFRRDARHWLTRHSRDFRIVCEHAGYNPDWLQQEINRFLANHESPPAIEATFPDPQSQHFSISYHINKTYQSAEIKEGIFDNA